VNINDVPSGNFVTSKPGFMLSGRKPYPYYTPQSAASFVVDKGVDVCFPYTGDAPDLGV